MTGPCCFKSNQVGNAVVLGAGPVELKYLLGIKSSNNPLMATFPRTASSTWSHGKQQSHRHQRLEPKRAHSRIPCVRHSYRGLGPLSWDTCALLEWGIKAVGLPRIEMARFHASAPASNSPSLDWLVLLHDKRSKYSRHCRPPR